MPSPGAFESSPMVKLDSRLRHDKKCLEFVRENAETLKEIQRRLARAWARFCNIAYTKSKNPIYPWSAYKKLRASGQDIPIWVLEYLDKCSKELDILRQQPPDRVNTAISQALGFAKLGRGTVFSQFDQDLRDFEIEKEVHLGISNGTAQDHVCYFIEKEQNVRKATILRAYAKFQDIFEE